MGTNLPLKKPTLRLAFAVIYCSNEHQLILVSCTAFGTWEGDYVTYVAHTRYIGN